MITIKEDTTLVGISELRTNMDKVLKEMKKHKILLQRRNKPIAVIISIDKYNYIEEIIGSITDMGLGYLAKERDSNSKPSDYIDLEVAEKRINKK